MAKLRNLPSLEIIMGFKGVIDFAITRGVPYARKWPYTPRSHLTQASLATAAIFGQVISAFTLLAPNLLALLKIEASDQPRSERDIYVQAVYGYLHEDKMTDILTELQSIDDHLAALQALLFHLDTVTAEDIKTALQLIDDFALPSNKIFGYFDTYNDFAVVDGDGGTVYAICPFPPADEIWVVTSMAAWHNDPVPRNVALYKNIPSGDLYISYKRNLPTWEYHERQGTFIFRDGESAGAWFDDLAAGYWGAIMVVGYKMKVL